MRDQLIIGHSEFTADIGELLATDDGESESDEIYRSRDSSHLASDAFSSPALVKRRCCTLLSSLMH